MERENERLGWLLIFPSILVVTAVAIYPLFESFRISLTSVRTTREGRFVGLDNYVNLFQDGVWTGAIWNTFVFTFVSVVLETVLGMIVALVMNSEIRGRGVLRTASLVPWAIPTVVSSLLWSWMFHDRLGVINDMLMAIGLDRFQNFAWTNDPSTSLLTVIMVDVWKTTPFMALLLLAGLQVIPGDVYEASTVDGASKWQQFWQITLPLVRPALVVALIFRTMASFRVFDMIFVMKGYATDTMSVAVYTHREIMTKGRIGFGSASAVVIFLSIALLTIAYTRLIKVEEQ